VPTTPASAWARTEGGQYGPVSLSSKPSMRTRADAASGTSFSELALTSTAAGALGPGPLVTLARSRRRPGGSCADVLSRAASTRRLWILHLRAGVTASSSSATLVDRTERRSSVTRAGGGPAVRGGLAAGAAAVPAPAGAGPVDSGGDSPTSPT